MKTECEYAWTSGAPCTWFGIECMTCEIEELPKEEETGEETGEEVV